MLPANGLLTDVAYRWDIICDFTGYTANVSTLLEGNCNFASLPDVESAVSAASAALADTHFAG